MKTRLFFLFTALCLPLYASAACPAAQPGELRIYDGTIGNQYPIRMTLQYQDGGVAGVYFYTSQLKDIKLQGQVTGGQDIVLKELDDQGVEAARFSAAFPTHDPHWGAGKTELQCEVLSGVWQKNGAAKKLPVRLSLSAITSGSLAQPYGEGVDAALVHQRALQFQRAVKAGDKNTVAGLIAYPLKVNLGKRTTIAGAAELVRQYDHIFMPALKAKIAGGIARNMSQHNGNLMLGNGEVWFQHDGKVISLNN